MGGSAFSSVPDPPYMPRMPRNVYQRVLANCHAALRDLFVCVATPIEGPEKKDYGDIDILVALERRVVFPNAEHGGSVPRTPHELISIVQRTLSAKHAIVRGSSANLAIPWPSDMDEHGNTLDGASKVGAAEGKYIQLDINICPDLEQLCWVSIPPLRLSLCIKTMIQEKRKLTGTHRSYTSMPMATSGISSEAPSVRLASQSTRKRCGCGYPRSKSSTARRPRCASPETLSKSCSSSE